MILWCAYCQEFQGEVEPLAKYNLTHGICPVCMGKGLDALDDDFSRIRTLQGLQDDLLNAGLSQDLIAAKESINKARLMGIKNVDILVGIIAPILWQTGDLWETGEISVADEHRFSAFLATVIHEIEGVELTRAARVPQQGIDILLADAPGNYHTLGIRIANLWLNVNGVSAKIVAGKTSFNLIQEKIQKYQPKFVGFSLALSEQKPATLALCDQLRLSLPAKCPEFLLGGLVAKNFANAAHANVTFLFDLRQALALIKEPRAAVGT